MKVTNGQGRLKFFFELLLCRKNMYIYLGLHSVLNLDITDSYSFHMSLLWKMLDRTRKYKKEVLDSWKN